MKTTEQPRPAARADGVPRPSPVVHPPTTEQPRPAVRGGVVRRPSPVVHPPVAAPMRSGRSRLRARDLRPAAAVALAIVVGGMLVIAASSGLTAQRAVVEAVALGLRTVVFAAALTAVGGVVFLATVHDGQVQESTRLRRLFRTVAGTGVAAIMLSVPVHAAVISGGGIAGLVDARAAGAVASSPFGLAAALRTCGLAGIAWGVGRRGRVPIAAGGALLVLAPFAFTGHAATADPRWLVAGSTLAHTAAAGVWLGGLLGLAVVLAARRHTGDAGDEGAAIGAAALVGRFSTVAGASLAAIVPTGTLLAIVEVGSVSALVTSGYGRALLVKVVLVAAVVALGAYNRWLLVPAITVRAGGAWARLTSTVRWELVGLVAVVVATGVLGRLAAPA